MPITTLLGHAAAEHIATFTRANAKPSEFMPGCFESASLCRVQSQLRAAGFIEAEVLKSAYGYSLRNASGLDGFGLIASARRRDVDGSFADAVRAAERWVAIDPARRTVFARDMAPADLAIANAQAVDAIAAEMRASLDERAARAGR